MKRQLRNPSSEIQNPVPLVPRRSSLVPAAFTLVELLVVITIISILAGLTVGVALNVRKKAMVAAIVNDVKQLDAACQEYKNKFGEYPPDGNTTSGTAAMLRHIRKAFPLYTGDIPAGMASLTPFNSLTFWLGGMWDSDNQRFSGFAADPTNPFQTPAQCAARIGPFFEFDPNRCGGSASVTIGTTTMLARYWPQGATAGDVTTGIGAIAYFRADNGKYLDSSNNTKAKSCADTDGGVVYPAQDSRLSTSSMSVWINPKSFQIFSSGLGLKYGNPGGAINFPSGAAGNNGFAYGTETYDDIANFFTRGTLEDAIPQ